MEWWQTFVVALVSPVLPTGALFLQQRRAHDREDRIRGEDRGERARDRWRDERLATYTLLLVRLNRELDAFRAAVNVAERDDGHRTSSGLEWSADDPVLVEEALAGVQLVGSAHAVGTAEHAYTQLLLARAALTECAESPRPLSESAMAQLLAERQALFEAIDGYREAARDDLEVT